MSFQSESMVAARWRSTILAMRDPLAQRFSFAKYVLGEGRMSALGIAAHFASLGLMDEREYDVLAARWGEA